MTYVRRLNTTLALLCVSFLATELAAQTLDEQLLPLIEAHPGTVGVAIKFLPTGESFTHNADQPLPTASLIKLPILVTLHDRVEKGQADLATPIRLKEEDKVPGSGILTANFSAGMTLSLSDAARLMIVFSDNTATNLVIDQVGLRSTADLMEQLGFPHTKLHSKVFRRDTSLFPERSKQFGLGSTTAAEMVSLLEQLANGEMISAAASQNIIKLLGDCDDRTKIPRDLPPGIKVAHKTGAVSNSRTDAGLIFSPAGEIAVCVLTHDNEDRGWDTDNAANVLCGKIARIAYDYFNPDPRPDDEKGPLVLAVGSDGELVESLQRTLNARLEPSPDLGVDGDFGPMTEAAVIAFQSAHNLPTNGKVDAATWKALGPLVTDEQVPAPDVVNAEVIEKETQPPLDGPPIVTCQAWAIGNGQSGKLLWGYNEDAPLNPASTTKIMTGYLVTSLAEQDPAVLDEIVTFSQRADDTIGSSCGVRAGEQLSVRELLYGLLLPSGNDASVALAEHFGARLAAGGGPENQDRFASFVEKMNHTAAELGMTATHYNNTHGLTEPKHLTSARDLLTLAHRAMSLEEFRRRTATVQHGCTVTSEAGYQRNVVWRNTNRLLRTEGYDGVKTGTTNAAGACLVSRGEHLGRQLIVVVLGSASSDSRYADSRNLIRWAWQQLGKE